MRKRILGIIVIIMLAITLISLTGCGANDEIISSLNSAIETIGEDGDYHISTIQKAFEDNTKYKLIDADRSEFTEKPDNSNSKFSTLQYSEQLINVGGQYILIYDTDTEEYYCVTVSYIGYKPTFVNATKIQ